MAERELLVRIIGDDRDLQRAFTNSERRAGQFDSRMSKLNQGLRGALSGLGSKTSLLFGSGAFIGTAGITAALGKSVDAASDLNEEVSKSRQIFGDASTAVETFARNAADSLGVSRTEALAATGTFGNLFTTVGLGQQAMAGMSQDLVTLAADLASFNNADISDVLAAIRSGLIGEAEPLRRYGVLLSEARVQQLALSQTGKENVKELTNQEKALARFNIIINDTAAAAGDFDRTSQGLANQSRILKAQIADLSAELGTKLLPTVLRVVSATNGLIDAFMQAGDSLDPRLGQTLQDVDISAIVAMRDRLAEVKGEGDAVVGVLNEIIDRLRAVQGVVVGGPDSRAGLRGPGGIAASNALVDERTRQRDEARQTRNAEKRQKAFDTFIKGLGLKLDKAALTKSLQDDLAVLKEIERAIRRRIEAQGRTFELEQQLTDNLLKQQQISEAQQADAQERTEAAAERKAEVQDRSRDRRRKRLQRRQQGRQGDQFKALGLTREGDQRVPGVESLRQRLGSVRQSVQGTLLDTTKTEAQLDKIAAVLSGKFGKVGRDVRQSILRMLNDISSALEGKGAKTGPMTKFQKRGIGELIEGLGLSDEEVKALRQRFAQLGPGGTVPGKGIGAFGFAFQPGTGSTFATQNQRNVEEFHIYIDGEEVESRVTKRQQRKNGRTAKQRRGTRPGI